MSKRSLSVVEKRCGHVPQKCRRNRICEQFTRISLGVFLCWFGAGGGCSQAINLEEVPGSEQESGAGDEDQAPVPNEQTSTGPHVTLEHDFGMLRPRQKMRHEFELHNNAESRWTFHKIANTCGCIAVSASKPCIDPGQTANVLVAYAASGKPSDDNRTVTIWFAEQDAPRVLLAVRAKVRDAMQVSPAEVVFNGVGQGQSREARLEVANYEKANWPSLEVTSPADWLTCSATRLPDSSAPLCAREVWRVTLRADAASLDFGRHQANVSLEGGSGAARQPVPVDLVVRPPVAAIPSEIFFGRVRVGEHVQRKVLLHFAAGSSREGDDSVPVQVAAEDGVTAEIARRSSQFCELTLDFCPRVRGTRRADMTERIQNGRVVVRFASDKLPELSIRYQGMVVPPEALR